MVAEVRKYTIKIYKSHIFHKVCLNNNYIPQCIRFIWELGLKYIYAVGPDGLWIMNFEMDMKWPTKIHNSYGLWIFYGFST